MVKTFGMKEKAKEVVQHILQNLFNMQKIKDLKLMIEQLWMQDNI